MRISNSNSRFFWNLLDQSQIGIGLKTNLYYKDSNVNFSLNSGDVESDSEIFSCYGSSNNNNNNSSSNNNVSVPSTKEDSGNDKSSTALSPNSAEPEMAPVAMNTPIPQAPFEMCHNHMDLSREGRVFPPIGFRNWMNNEHSTIFSTNAIIGNGGQSNMLPNFMNSLNMIPGAFSNMGLLHQVNFEANCRNPNGYIHQIDPNKSA